MLNCVRVFTAVVVWSSFCFVAQAETVWWDHEYNASTMLNHASPDAHTFPGQSYTSDVIYYNDSVSNSTIGTSGGTASLVSCPTCVGGNYFRMEGNRKWQNGIYINQTPDPNTDGDNNPGTNTPAWNKAAGYWPQPSDVGCPGNFDASPFPHWKESGWYIPGTGLGNSGCMAGGATIELRYKWTCESGTGCDAAHKIGNREGGMPLMYPPMQYQGMMYTRSDIGDYIEFATWGDRPHVDIGDDWVVVRMVVGSSWEGLDYYIHDDGSMEPGTGDNRGADWQDASGNNQFGRDETVRVVTFANPFPGAAPEQNDRGWKGFETGGGGDYSTRISSGDAVLEVDYIRWAFDKKIAPTIIPEPATMALVGLGALLCLKRRRRH